MPLTGRHGRDLDEHPVPGTEVEPLRPLDDELRDAGGEEDPGLDDGLAVSEKVVEDPVGDLHEPDESCNTVIQYSTVQVYRTSYQSQYSKDGYQSTVQVCAE